MFPGDSAVAPRCLVQSLARKLKRKKQIDTRHLIHCPRFNLRNPYRTFERLEKGIPDQQQVASDGEIGRETEVQEEQD